MFPIVSYIVVLMSYKSRYLRPRSKGRKLAWQGAWHENVMTLRMRIDAADWRVVKYEVLCDWRFQAPPPIPCKSKTDFS